MVNELFDVMLVDIVVWWEDGIYEWGVVVGEDGCFMWSEWLVIG